MPKNDGVIPQCPKIMKIMHMPFARSMNSILFCGMFYCFLLFNLLAVRFLRINLASLNAGTMQLLAIANKVGCPVAVLTRRYLEFLYFM